MKYFIIIVILLLSLLLQCILSIKEKVATFDEPAHLPAGYSYLITKDFRMNPEHPPLIKMISAFPFLFLKLKNPVEQDNWKGTDSFAFGKEFLYHSGGDADRIIFLGRIPIILLSCVLGLLVFSWAKELFGLKAGVFALFLYTFCPNILAHSRLVTQDIGVSLFITLAAYCLWRYLVKPNNLSLILSGITLGLALLSKFNAIVLIPVFIIFIYIYRPKNKISHFFVPPFLIFSIALLTIWLGYGFEAGKILEKKKEYNTFDQLIKNYPEPVKNTVCSLGKHLCVPVPSYFKGLGWLAHAYIEKHESFLWGRHFRGGSLLGFLLAFIIKTPIPFLIFIFLSLFIAIKNKLLLKKDQVFLWVFPLVIFIISAFCALGLHIKYILPVYPFLCIFISQIVNSGFFHLRLFRLTTLGMCAWYLLGTFSIYPHYLAYFNEFIGGPKNGYKYLVDSNLDWGQDLKLLKKYLDKNNIKEIKLAYFGTAEPDYYKIKYQKLGPFEAVSGWVAVSATYLQGVHVVKKGYEWLKHYKPVTQIGYSIFVYKI